MRTKILATTTVAAALILTACGGGDSAPASAGNTLSGTAAVGVPIIGGNVSVTCAGGSPLSATTVKNGTWQVTTSGQLLPCAVQVSGGTVGGSANGTPYHSIAMSFGTVNITPLTDLVIANLAGKSPKAWFDGLNAAALEGIKDTALKNARNNVNTALGLSATLNGANPLTTAFTATKGNLFDDILEAIAKAWQTASLDYAGLLTLAAGNNFTAPTGFNFSTAYAAVQAANGGGTGGTGGTGGNANLVVQVTASGISTPAINVGSVPVPGSQSEFCSELSNDTTFSQIGTSGGGTLTINSCTFANKVGNINATLTITSPMSMSLPYSIKYTYQ